MDRESDDRSVYQVNLTRSVDTPFRFMLATLTGSNAFWLSWSIFLPTTFVLLSGVNNWFAEAAVGVSVGVSLWFVWMSHEFVTQTVTFDRNSGTITKSKPFAKGEYSPIELENVVRVTALRFNSLTLVKFKHESSLSSKPLSVIVDNSHASDLIAELERYSVDVGLRDVSLRPVPNDSVLFRLVATPFVLISVPVVVWYLHGTDPFASNLVVVPLITLIIFWIRGLILRGRVRESHKKGDV